MSSQSEKTRLEEISDVSLYCAGVNSTTIKYSFKIAQRHLVGDSILEMGPAEGIMTELLAATGKKLTLVEGSGLFCDSLRRRFPQSNIVHSLVRGIPIKRALRQHRPWPRSRTRGGPCRHFVACQTVAQTGYGTAICRRTKCPFRASSSCHNHGNIASRGRA